MSLQSRKLLQRILRIYTQKACSFSTAAELKDRGDLIINCKRQQYNFYANDQYRKLEEIPLASKGWCHNKSKGDYFIVRPVKDECRQEFLPFQHTGIHPKLLEQLDELGIKEATAFQVEGIQAVRDHNHVVLAAETGCGKTLTYVLPILNALIGCKAQELNSPKALILVPNRELAHQVGDVANELAKAFDLNVKTVVGGRTKKLMLNPELSDIDILVGTPGALGKLSSIGLYKLGDVKYTVLDEADTLLDDSFEERMAGIIRRIPQSKVILVAATLPKALPPALRLMEEDLHQVISPKLHKPLLNVTQKFVRMTRSDKPAHLLELAQRNKHPMVVFTNKSQTCDWLAMYLRENGLKCANINGRMNHAIRMEQWEDFIWGGAKILSATDVGSRGLDTTQVRHVLNYDFPMYTADYIHRVGRTGRFGSHETSAITNFVTGPIEVRLVQQIELAIRRRIALENVDGNITSLVQEKILKQMRDVA